jgi:hypothetical protein
MRIEVVSDQKSTGEKWRLLFDSLGNRVNPSGYRIAQSFLHVSTTSK